MYKIYFYKDSAGKEPVKEYIKELAEKTDKDSRIKLKKIRDYIKALSKYGTVIGEPYIKHVEGEIWELRPINDRIFFVAWNGNSFVLLHHFRKKTQKTPARELSKAKKEWAQLKSRGQKNE